MITKLTITQRVLMPKESEEKEVRAEEIIINRIKELKTKSEDYDKIITGLLDDLSSSNDYVEKHRYRSSLEKRMGFNNELKAKIETLEEILELINQLDEPETDQGQHFEHKILGV